MERRIVKIYFAVLAAGILFALFITFSYGNNIFTRTGDNGVSIWDGKMELSREGNTYYYSTRLPENTDEKVIVYNTVHMELIVDIDGNKVYELKSGGGKKVKTTGFCWNIISLTNEDAGSNIVFKVTPVYSDSKPGGSFLYGTYREIEHRILGERIFRFMIACMIALAGIFMFAYGILIAKKGHDTEKIIQFSIFSLMLGIWSVLETQILDLFFPSNIVIVFVSHLMLMIMPVPFVLFLRHMYHNGGNWLWSICCYFNCIVVVARVLLQIAGIFDLRETLWMTHVSILLSAVIIVGMSIHELVVNKLSRQVKINSIGVMVILASTVLEMGIYRFSNRSTPLGSMGFLIYIVVMGIENVRKSRRLMERAKESEIYRKLAFTDELTGLYNRTAFIQDVEHRTEMERTVRENKRKPAVIYMFDLNDLKKCNDTYGHDYGDQYIMMAAEILKKLFALDGKCCRIGGDEFCALAPYASQKEINEKMFMLERYTREQNRKEFVVPVSIAAGFAVYTKDRDSSLSEAMKRADEMMYEKKQEYKKRSVSA